MKVRLPDNIPVRLLKLRSHTGLSPCIWRIAVYMMI
jgi:hypothetical protein